MEKTPPKAHIVISTPAYTGRLTVGYTVSIGELMAAGTELGYVVERQMTPGDGLIQRQRNLHAALFMVGPGTHLMFIDDDIEFSWNDVLRLVESGHDVIGGVYRKRSDKVSFPVVPVEPMAIEDDGCMEVKYASTGFLCISRRALEKMIAAYPERRCILQDGGWYARDNRMSYDFFPCDTDETGLFLSEDWGFCRLWRDIGGKIYVMPDIRLGHIGETTYRGAMVDHMDCEVTIDQMFDAAYALDTDIRDHMPTLRDLAKGKRILELGVRTGMSTTAFLAGRPRSLVSVDIEAPRVDWRLQVAARRLRKECGTEWTMLRSDSVRLDFNTEIAPGMRLPQQFDIVFFDTLHTAEHLGNEIKAHANRAAERLVFHDTLSLGDIGEDGKPGIWVPIRELLAHGEWEVEYHYEFNNGLLVLRRKNAQMS